MRFPILPILAAAPMLAAAPLLAVAPMLAVVASCAPIIHPPSPPQGFLNPPRTTYAGALSRDGVAAIAPEAPPGPSLPAAGPDNIGIEYFDGGRALVHVAPTCTLPAIVLSPPYLERPGSGFTRQGEGILAFQPGGRCALDAAAPFTVLAGNATVRGVGLLDLTAAGRSDQGASGSIRFTGALASESEPVTPPTTVKVHLLSELVSSCQFCRFNHHALWEPGQFPFAPGLEQEIPTPAGPTWRPICAAPCVAAVDPSALLRVAGAGLRESTPFRLPANRPGIILRSSSSGTAARAFGWTFLVAGASFVAAGATMLAVGIHESPQTAAERSAAHGWEIGGASFALGSLAFLIPGLIVLAHDGTAVTTDAGERLAAP
jgi:hypothetical protein